MQQSSTSPRKRSPLTAVGALLWVVLVIGLYYWVHKPLTPALARAVVGAVLDVGVASVFVVVAGGVGRRVLIMLLPDVAFWSVPERVAASALVGLGLLSLALVLVGAIVLNALSVAALLIGCAGVTWRHVLGWGGELRAVLRGGLPTDRWERALAAVVLVMLGIALLLALLPPTKWDVLTYHLAGAEQYVERGRFYAVPHNHFLGFPQLGDTLYAGHLALTGQLTGPAVIHWWAGVLLLLAAGGYAARRAGSAVGWLAAAVLVTMPSLWSEMTSTYVDVYPVAFAVLGVSLIDRWRESHEADHTTPFWRYLVVVGMLAGFGLGVKYSVLWLAVALGVLILWAGRRDGLRRVVIYGAVYSAAALVVFAPWLVRNAIWYENPVYPLVFEGGEMDDIRQDWYSQPESGLIYSSDRWQIPVLPLLATFLGLETGGPFGADIGPVYLLLLPLLALSWGQIDQRLRTTVTYAGIVAGVVLLAWWGSSSAGSYVSKQTRLVFYMFGPLALIAAVAFESLRRLPKKPFDVYFVLRALVGLTFIFTVIDAARVVNNSGVNVYFNGEDDHEERYLEEALGWHYATIQEVNALPQGSSVRFLWEPRYLYCNDERVNCITDSLMDGWYYARRTIADGTPDSIGDAWREQAYDHFLVYEFGRNYEKDNSDFYTADDWHAWETFVDQYLAEVWRGGGTDEEPRYVIYQWQGAD